MIFNKNIYLFYESINIFQITFISNKNLLDIFMSFVLDTTIDRCHLKILESNNEL
jgi:hypothetical protein